MNESKRFIKAYVFLPSLYKMLLKNLINEWDEDEDENETIEEFLETKIDDLLDDDKIDLLMIYEDETGKWKEIISGKDFVSFAKKRGDLNGFENVGESKITKRRLSRFYKK